MSEIEPGNEHGGAPSDRNGAPLQDGAAPGAEDGQAALRVLLVLGTSTGGVVRHVAQIADGLRAAGLSVRVCGPADVRFHFAGHPFAELPIGPRPKVTELPTVRRLAVLSRGADVVHAHGLRAGALTVLAGRSLLRPRSGPRTVVTLHNLAVGGRVTLGISRVLERIVARGADVVLGVSMDIVDSVRRLGARNALRALVPAPSTPVGEPRGITAVRRGLEIEHGNGLVLTVGRLATQKGLDTLLDAAAFLKDQRPAPFTWFIAGSGPLQDELAVRISNEELPVRLLGARDDVADLLAAADVVVSTAVWEGQPIGIQEALRAGAVLVVTDAGGTREVTGLAGASVVPVGAAEKVASETARFLDDPAVRAAQRQRALARAEELPGPKEVVVQLRDVYREQK